VQPDPKEQATLAQLQGLVRALDGGRLGVGLDPLIGLVPVVGDWVGAGLSGYIIVRAAALGVSGATLLRMIGNLVADLLAGSVPVLGDIFDFGFKANRRNLALLERHMEAPARRRKADLAVVLGVGAGLLVVIVGVLTLSIWLVASLAQAVAGQL
jgi:hypothetical protein